MFDYTNGFMMNMYFNNIKNKGKNINKYKNNRSFMNAYATLYNLCVNMFQWEGLPDTIDERFVERTLIESGRISIAKDDELGFIALPFSETDKFNIYGESPIIKLYGRNGYSKDFDAYVPCTDNSIAKAVKGYDNRLGYPYSNIIVETAERLAETSRSIDVATKKLKNPYFFVGDKAHAKEYQDFMKQLTDNHEAIMLTDNLSIENTLKVEQTSFDVAILNALWEQKRRYSNEAREALGIENNENIDKNERLLVDEVNANNTATDMNLDVRLRARQEFCDIVNKHFGLNISVKIRHDEMIKEFKDVFEPKNEEEESDETI